MDKETIEAYGGEEKIRMLAEMANNPAYFELMNSQEEDAINTALSALDPLDTNKIITSMLTLKMVREYRYAILNAAKLAQEFNADSADEPVAPKMTGREFQHVNRGRR